MKNVNLFQKITLTFLGVFGGLAFITWALINLNVFPAQNGAWFSPGMIILVMIWGFSMLAAATALACFTQSIPLKSGSTMLKILSLVGMTLMVIVLLYTIAIFAGPIFGYNTNTLFFGFTSSLMKTLLVIGSTLMFSAFLYSFEPKKLSIVRIVTLACAIFAAILYISSLYQYDPQVYNSFVRFFVMLAAIGVLATVYLARAPRPKKNPR